MRVDIESAGGSLPTQCAEGDRSEIPKMISTGVRVPLS